MNDDEKEVRVAVSNLFRTDVLHINENISFVQSFVKSKSIPEETFGFFHCIEEHKESLIPFADVMHIPAYPDSESGFIRTRCPDVAEIRTSFWIPAKRFAVLTIPKIKAQD